MPDMKAAVIYEAGGPEVLKIQSRPIPTPRPDEVLIRVKAFGLNRSELFTRQGHSSGVNPERNKLLLESGADQVFIDTGSIAEQVREVGAGGVDKVLELIGTATLKDSLLCARQGGIVCMTGIVGNKWSFDDFAPMEAIPSAIYLTSYNGKSEDFMRTPLDELAQQIGAGKLRVQIGKVFHFDEIVEAHRVMEENKAGGKIVVLT
jgi:NADPH:quinone reductase-like Zn-dependent oxidoreductase